MEFRTFSRGATFTHSVDEYHLAKILRVKRKLAEAQDDFKVEEHTSGRR